LKVFYKVLIGLAIIFALYFTAITLVSFYYEKEIEKTVITEVNKHLVNPIQIDHIGISTFSNFPFVSFSMNDVVLPKSDSSGNPLLKFKKLQILFSPLNIIIKKFSVNDIIIEDGFMDLRVDSLGNRDFNVIIKKDSSEKEHQSISNFSIGKIIFKNLAVYYENIGKHKRVDLFFKQTESSISLESGVVSGKMQGIAHSTEVTLKAGTLFKQADLNMDFNYEFDLEKKLFTFNNSQLISGNNIYIGKGSIDFKNQSLMHLNVKTQHADIAQVIALLSEKWTVNMKPLNLTGHVDADATFIVSLLPGNQPIFDMHFSTDDLDVNHKDIKANIHQIALEGSLTSNNSVEMEDYALTLNNVYAHIDSTGTLDAKQILLSNFKEPILKIGALLKLKGVTLFNLINFKRYSDIGGDVSIDVTYDGAFNYLLGKKSSVPNMYGSINLDHMKVKLDKLNFTFDELNGDIAFKNDSIKLNKLLVRSGKSDLLVTGNAHKLFNSIFSDTTGLNMDIQFTSNNFYFTDFTDLSQKQNKKQQSNKKPKSMVNGNSFVLPYDMKVVMRGKVKNFYARTYHGNNIDLNVKLSNQKVEIIESMSSFGGNLSFSSQFIPRNNHVHCTTNLKLNKFEIDKVFSGFNNFKQDLLTSENIKGVVSGKVYSYFKMNSYLIIDTTSIYVKGAYSIRNFELKNVEPIMKLMKVGFDEDDLKRVTFENINSTIEFKNNELTIPRTLFVSNILYFYLDVKIKDGGESVINILLPIKNLKKKVNTEGLTNDSKAGLSLPIKIIGKAGKMIVL
jgi:hypothetical protein